MKRFKIPVERPERLTAARGARPARRRATTASRVQRSGAMRFWAIFGLLAAVLALSAAPGRARRPARPPGRPGSAPLRPPSSCSWSFPLTADLAGLERFADVGHRRPARPATAITDRSPSSPGAFGATARDPRRRRQIPPRGGRHRRQARRDRAVRRRDRQREAGREAVLHTAVRPTTRRARPGSPRPPRSRSGAGGSPRARDRRRRTRHPPAQRSRRGPGGGQHAGAGARRSLPARAPHSRLSGTPAGCAGRGRLGGLRAQPVPDRLWALAPVRGEHPRTGRARRADRDRWLPRRRHQRFRPVLRPRRAATSTASGSGSSTSSRPAASRRSTSRCSTPPRLTEGDRRLRDQAERRRHAEGADRSAPESRLSSAGDLSVAGSVRGRRQPRRRLEGHQVGRGRAADGRLERDHVPVLQRRPGLGGLRRAQQPADRPPRRQLPGLVAVGHRRRRHQPRARLRQPDQSIRSSGTTPRCSPALPEAAAPACCSIGPTYQKGTGQPQRSRRARRLDARRHRPGLRGVLLRHRRLRHQCDPEPVADGRRHERRHALAGRRAGAGGPAAAAQRPARPRVRQPAALPNRSQLAGCAAACSPTCSSSATTSVPISAAPHKPLGCCTAGRGYDRASGWGSVNLSGFATAAIALTPPNVSLSLPRPQHVIKSKAVLATVSCSAACRDRRRRRDQDRPLRAAEERLYASRRCSAAGKVTATIPLTAKELSQIHVRPVAPSIRCASRSRA